MPFPKRETSGSKVPYISLKDEGEHRVRIVSSPVESWEHFLEDKKRSVQCQGRNTCEHCHAGVESRHRYFFSAIDRDEQTAEFKKSGQMKTGNVKLLCVGNSVYDALADLSVKPDWFFEEVPHYDIIITRKGAKMDTKYTVTPCAPKPLSEADAEAVKGHKSIVEMVNENYGLSDGDQGPTPSDSENPQHLADRMPNQDDTDPSSIPF